MGHKLLVMPSVSLNFVGRLASLLSSLMQLSAFQGTNYLVIGCTNGIYVRDLVNDSRESSRLLPVLIVNFPAAFRQVLEINDPTSIVAVSEFNEFLVHYESALYSYPLDLIVRVSRGDATPEGLDDSKERLAQGRGDVLFMKVGCIFDETLSE